MADETKVKICGLKTPHHVAAAVAAGAGYLGFNFFPKSPRYTAPTLASTLAVEVPPGVAKVGLVVDADDSLLDMIVDQVPLDMLQLHGRESAARVADVRHRYGLPVMKAVGVADESDLAALEDYGRVADQLLVDAKPAPDADLPGGNGLPFDWRLLAGRKWQKPWMLAGGLTPENVARAINMTGAQQVDVSSGVEIAPGEKDETLIAAFIKAAKGETA